MKKILHIDDEADIRELLGACLTSQGYEVVSVATPTEAFQVIQQAAPALIICDLQLEESDGLQTIDRLRTALPDVPIILLTGVLIAPHVARETFGQKVSAYLEKTAPLQRILDEIQRLVS